MSERIGNFSPDMKADASLTGRELATLWLESERRISRLSSEHQEGTAERVSPIEETIKVMESMGLLEKHIPRFVWEVAQLGLQQTFEGKSGHPMIKDQVAYLSILASLKQIAK